MQTLTIQGMLAFYPDRQTHSMVTRLVRLAHSSWRPSSLAPVARSFIEALAAEVGEAVHLAQFDNGHLLFVDKCKATADVETLAQAGKITLGYCTGVGKAILASMLRVEQNHALEQQSYVVYTPFTLTSRSALVERLTIIETNSVVYDREEHEQGIISIASPILTISGRAIGALSIATSTNRHTIEELEKHRSSLPNSTKSIGI
tara:strand:+ start:316 stop:927 length:612 start_codon:yes stop_codon:yes gene_type:complete